MSHCNVQYSVRGRWDTPLAGCWVVESVEGVLAAGREPGEDVRNQPQPFSVFDGFKLTTCDTYLPQHITLQPCCRKLFKVFASRDGARRRIWMHRQSISFSVHFRSPLAICRRMDEHVCRARTYNERRQARVCPEGQMCNPSNVRYMYAFVGR